jgi:hypothetical protein
MKGACRPDCSSVTVHSARQQMACRVPLAGSDRARRRVPSSPRLVSDLATVKFAGGGAWRRRRSYFLCDALPCAAGVLPVPVPAHEHPIGWMPRALGTAQGRIRPARPRGQVRRHTCLDGGRGHPFPPASCGVKYAGGSAGGDEIAVAKTAARGSLNREKARHGSAACKISR